jgi:hypothetical protein
MKLSGASRDMKLSGASRDILRHRRESAVLGRAPPKHKKTNANKCK